MARARWSLLLVGCLCTAARPQAAVEDLAELSIQELIEADLRAGYRLREDVDVELVARDLLDGRHQEYFPTSLFTAPAEVERVARLGLRWRF